MPTFGETAISQEQVVATHPDGAGFDAAVIRLLQQLHLRRPQVTFSVVHTANYDYILARTFRANLGPTQDFTPNPDQWWIYDVDADEDASWVAQGTFNAQGYIDYGPDGEAPVRLRQTRSASFEDPDPPGALERLFADEGDRIGADPPRPSITRHVHEELQRQRGDRLPQGNSSVRDAVARMRQLDPKDAVFADDPSLGDMMLGNNFLRPTPTSTYNDGSENGQPAEPAKPKSVYDHLMSNVEDLRNKRPVPSVWERIARQRGKK